VKFYDIGRVYQNSTTMNAAAPTIARLFNRVGNAPRADP
jgi:hypothetical protein